MKSKFVSEELAVRCSMLSELKWRRQMVDGSDHLIRIHLLFFTMSLK